MTSRHDLIVANLERHGALPTVRRICAKAHQSLADVLGKRRPASLVRARHECWSVISGTLGLSLQETADMFGVGCHQTVLSALRKRALFLSPSYPTCTQEQAFRAANVTQCHTVMPGELK